MRRLLHFLLGVIFCLPAAAQVAVSGSNVQNISGLPLASGQWCYGSTCFTVTNGAFSGSVTASSQAVTVVNASSVTILTVNPVTISTTPFDWDQYTVPYSITYSGKGAPYLPCQVNALYTQTDSTPVANATWNCNFVSGMLVWQLNIIGPPLGPGLISGLGAPTFSAIVPTFYYRTDTAQEYQLAGLSGAVSSTWNLAGGTGSFLPLTGGTLTGPVSGPSLRVSLLSFASPSHPIVTTQGNTTDSSYAIQQAVTAVCNYNSSTNAVRWTLDWPQGYYYLNGASSALTGVNYITCPNGLEVRLEGQGKSSTTIMAGPNLVGQPIIQFSNSFHPRLSGMGFLGTTGSAPAEAIESRVVSTGLGWDENSGVVEDVAINIAQPSGGGTSSILNGIVLDHDTSGCPGTFTPSCDLNNDQWQFINVDSYATQWQYEFVGGNAEWETIIGGHMGGAECVHDVGGSFLMLGGMGGCTIIAHEVGDSNTNDFPYLKPSMIIGGRFEGPHQVLVTDPTGTTGGVTGNFWISQLDCSCGPTSSAGFIVDWESASATGKSANLTIRDSKFSMGNGGIFKATDSASHFQFEGNSAAANALQYGNSLTSQGNTFLSSSSLPAFTYIGSGTADFCEFNDSKGAVVQPSQCTNWAGSAQGYNGVSAQTAFPGSGEINVGVAILPMNFLTPREIHIWVWGEAKSTNANTCTVTVRFSGGPGTPGSAFSSGTIVFQTAAVSASGLYSGEGVVQYNTAGTGQVTHGQTLVGATPALAAATTATQTPANHSYVNYDTTCANSGDTMYIDSGYFLVM